jgi:hypothetical protein
VAAFHLDIAVSWMHSNALNALFVPVVTFRDTNIVCMQINWVVVVVVVVVVVMVVMVMVAVTAAWW